MVSASFSLKEKAKLLRIPYQYRAASVQDYEETKSNLRTPFLHRFQENPIMTDYSSIHFFDIYLRPDYDDGEHNVEVDESTGNMGELFWMRDDTAETLVCWPKHSITNYVQMQIINSNFLLGKISHIELFYHRKSGKSYIFNVHPSTPTRGGKKDLDWLVNGLQPITL